MRTKERNKGWRKGSIETGRKGCWKEGRLEGGMAELKRGVDGETAKVTMTRWNQGRKRGRKEGLKRGMQREMAVARMIEGELNEDREGHTNRRDDRQ